MRQLRAYNVNHSGLGIGSVPVTVAQVMSNTALPEQVRLEKPEDDLQTEQEITDFAQHLAEHTECQVIYLFSDNPLIQTIPLDQYCNLIKLGDRLMVPMKSGGVGAGARIVFGTVTKIAAASHHRYGYWTRKLTIHCEDGKTIVHNLPTNCIKVSSKLPFED